jgi:two-component system, NarL family, response regulator DevR
VPDTGTIRVMIVEDHRIVAEGLVALLSGLPDMTVVGSAGSVAESAPLAQSQAPDVALLDFRLPDGTGAEAGARIRELRPDTKLIFLSRDDSDAARIAAVEVGASAFLHKSRAATEVVDVIRLVAKGANLITPRTVATLVTKRRTRTTQLQSLTAREKDVLRLLATGAGSRDISQALGISYTTMRTHLRSLGRKLGVHSRIEAIAKSRELGLLD